MSNWAGSPHPANAAHATRYTPFCVTTPASVLGSPPSSLFSAAPVDRVDRAAATTNKAFRHLPLQCILVLLRYCVVAKENYTMRTTAHCMQACRKLDELIALSLARMLGHTNPLKDESLQRCLRPYQRGGLALRSQESAAPAAFLGAIRDFFNSTRHPFERGLPSNALRTEMSTALTRLACTTRDKEQGGVTTIDEVLKAGRKLQRTLTRILDERTPYSHKRTVRAFQLSAGGPGSFHWLTVMPSCPELTLNDAQFRTSLSARIRVPAAGYHPRALCRACHKPTESAFHQESCQSIRQKWHDHLNGDIAAFLRSSGLLAVCETGGYVDGGQQHLDIDCTVVATDLTMTDVAQTSRLAKASSTGGWNAECAETTKKKKYDKLMRQNDRTFFPWPSKTARVAWASSSFASSNASSTTPTSQYMYTTTQHPATTPTPSNAYPSPSRSAATKPP
ncbi:hypothetical protein PTSG_02014 [Salpingoeca rosetta]|uniref:Uncharacterized protein n=1 Tax=Salpingoeca rosetta (strain ATCC 50818 / BSB-021) TaxID=946362 RepID=F2TZM2_SALR5|nr:uncharacterized protein PTSG_02014 [Salpingoeca rosetta]EGD79046.1 hypothetical protein PTSG_02014 [Salpingoeca rosetta]|eukprot:XP_004998002.1 hypothetical protein PTSG_02014 [Salpingoeca rosetta]